MRISDWSSDVCSSDLVAAALVWMLLLLGAGGAVLSTAFRQSAVQEFGHRLDALLRAMIAVTDTEIGRASCRESVCPYVYISVDAVSLQTNNVLTSYLLFR